MKTKFVLASLFAALLMLTVVTAVEAAPGCDDSSANSVWQVMGRHSKALQVRDKAYSREIIRRNDPALGMTCFDRAMAVTSRLGTFFSDEIDVDSAPDGVNFTGTVDMTLGLDDSLATELSQAVAPSLQDYLSAFDPTSVISSAFGSLVADFMDLGNTFISSINTALAPIMTTLATVSAAITTLNTALNVLDLAATALSLPLPSITFLPLIAAVNAARSAVQAAISAVVTMVTTAITSFINDIMTAIIGPTSTTALDNCDRFEDLWNSTDPANPSIEGAGLNDDTPYFNIEELISGAPPGVGPEMTEELGAGGNATILSDALADMTGALDAPGSMPTWNPVPAIASNPVADTSSIIGGM